MAPLKLKIQAVLQLAIFLACIGSTCGFAVAKSTSLVAMRRRALAKASPTTSTPTKSRKQKQQQPVAIIHQQLSKSFILEVLQEALFRQRTAIEALDREVERKKIEIEEEVENNESSTLEIEMVVGHDKDLQLEASKKNIGDNLLSRAEARKKELLDIDSSLRNLRLSVKQTNGQPSQEQLEQMKQQITQSGYGSIFRQPQSTWKFTKARDQEFGRPQGFDGDIFYSPLGVPILVGRMNAHKDEVMRSAAQGSDLWFQVEDYNGSRVLLRTSLMRGTAGSKQCRQMAADLAAKYSVWGDEYGYDSIPVMYTDSRKVAKRGSKVGNMKKNKSLGRIMGYPQNI